MKPDSSPTAGREYPFGFGKRFYRTIEAAYAAAGRPPPVPVKKPVVELFICRSPARKKEDTAM